MFNQFDFQSQVKAIVYKEQRQTYSLREYQVHSKLYKQKLVRLVVLYIRYISIEILFQNSVYSFGLAITFGLVYYYYPSRQLQSLRQVFLEFVYKVDISIRDNRYQSTIKVVDLTDKDIGDVFSIIYYIVGNIVMYLY